MCDNGSKVNNNRSIGELMIVKNDKTLIRAHLFLWADSYYDSRLCHYFSRMNGRTQPFGTEFVLISDERTIQVIIKNIRYEFQQFHY